MTFLNQTQLAYSDGKHAAALCPLSNQKKYLGYYISTPAGLVERPPDCGKKSFLSLFKDSTINNHFSVACGVPEVVHLTNKIAEQSTAKLKARAQVEAEDEAKKHRHGPASAKIVVATYWGSPEAMTLF